jgi:hypothetical protein
MTDDELQRLLALDAGPGPALAIDAGDTDAIIDAALAGAGFGPGGGSGGSGSAGTSGGAAVGTKLAIVGSAALVVVAIALFAGRGEDRADAPVLASIPDAALIDSGGAVETVAEPTVAPATDSSDDPSDKPSDDQVTIEPSTPPRPTRVKPARHESAADLLAEANAKRAAKQWRESDALYARVVERSRNSLAAQTALIASASLHLEHLGDPKGAAQRFRRALAMAPSGALAEDARWGIAEAARATNDRAAEADALDDFLAHHPSSPLASRAKARRAELP